MLGQRENIFAALLQRGDGERNHVEPVVKVGAECAGFDQRGQGAVCGGDYAHVYRQGMGVAQAVNFTFLQHAQEFGLQAERHLADFIQQQRAAVGHLKLSGFGGDGSGKSAAHMAESSLSSRFSGKAEQFTATKGFRGARAGTVNQPRQQFLSGAAFRFDQNVRFGERHAPRLASRA